MTYVLKCGWITCLDESMSTWLSRWTCPGWMFVPRKPRPFGNEYHSICCRESGIMFAIELCEGKDRPKELPSPSQNQSNLPATSLFVHLHLREWENCCLDSGFSVLVDWVEKGGRIRPCCREKRKILAKIRPRWYDWQENGRKTSCSDRLIFLSWRNPIIVWS